MRSLVYTGLLILLWIVNLFNGTGLDSVYHVTEWSRRIIIVLFGINILWEYQKNRALVIKRRNFIIFGCMIMIFIASPYIHGLGLRGINYLWVFCLVYLLSKFKIDDATIFLIGVIYGALGFIILCIYNYGTALKGWNSNSIAMIAMHSFLVLLVPFFKEKRMRNKIILIILAVLFALLISSTDSRSGILFAFIGVLFAIGLLPRHSVTKNHLRTLFYLNLPLIIAVTVTIISNSSIMEGLNSWSYQEFEKPIFNGRDLLWKYGLELLRKTPLIGNGNLNEANWHNSAITCLVATGILGYGFWIASLGKIMDWARGFLRDYVVIGCFVSFLTLYVQQSVELGFISGNPTLLGYALLGVMLGRVRFLKEREENEIYKN